MNGEENGAALEPADTGGEGAAEGAAEQVDTTAVDTEARSMGWVPKDEWKGDPDKWRPSDEFVQRGKEILPIVRSQLEREKSKTADLEKRLDEATATLKRVDRMTAIALERQKTQILSEFEAKKEAAVETGDRDAYRRVSEQERAALKSLEDDAKEAAKDTETPDKSGLSARDKAAVDEWVAENTWFNSSRLLRAAADDHFDDVAKEMPGATMAERLTEVRKRVAEDFPNKFGKRSSGNGASAVESGSRPMPASKARSSSLRVCSRTSTNTPNHISRTKQHEH
jgi:hypothetical protein